ncbi:MAG: VWA domain-containing protein [Acidobacteriia bacterium]|nr:VWA domain-containing protein [Terriglobia bacterium]
MSFEVKAASIGPLFVGLLLVGLLSFLASAQQMPTLRVDVSLVTVGVRVTDSHGREVPNLTAKDFTLFEDGIAQNVNFFSNEEQPVSLGILLDRSSSMVEGGKLERAKAAAQLMVDSAHSGTEFMYIPFDDRVEVSLEFTPDRESVKRQMALTTAVGGTSLYDAILIALEHAKHARHGRQALVIISDGADEHSEHTLQEVIHAVQESLVQVYAIGYFSKREEEVISRGGDQLVLLPGRFIDNPRVVFERLAQQSGAAVFFPSSDKALQAAAERISRDLSTQYTLGYYPSNPVPDNRYRRIKVTLRSKGLKVRARQGYVLPNTAAESPPNSP